MNAASTLRLKGIAVGAGSAFGCFLLIAILLAFKCGSGIEDSSELQIVVAALKQATNPNISRIGGSGEPVWIEPETAPLDFSGEDIRSYWTKRSMGEILLPFGIDDEEDPRIPSRLAGWDLKRLLIDVMARNATPMTLRDANVQGLRLASDRTPRDKGPCFTIRYWRPGVDVQNRKALVYLIVLSAENAIDAEYTFWALLEESNGAWTVVALVPAH